MALRKCCLYTVNEKKTRHSRGRNMFCWEWECAKRKRIQFPAVCGYNCTHINILITLTCCCNNIKTHPPMKSPHAFLGVPKWSLLYVHNMSFYSFWFCFPEKFIVYKLSQEFLPHEHGEKYPPCCSLLSYPGCQTCSRWDITQQGPPLNPHSVEVTLFYVLFQSLCCIFPVTFEALLPMQDSHNVLHDFSYIFYL